MRVISGKYKSRTLKTIKSQKTRPTTDKNKENLFNMIGPYFEGGTVLDLFCGSGALGIEALSRGCETGYFVDKAYPAYQVTKENIENLKIEQAYLYKSDYKKALELFKEKQIKFDLVLLDPPYKMKINQGILTYMHENKLLNKEALIVVEDTIDENIGEINNYTLIKSVQYGITIYEIYRYGGSQ